MPVWTPAAPATFPPVAAQQPAPRQPLPAHSQAFPPQAPQSEPPRRAPDPASYDFANYGLPTTQPGGALQPTGRDPRTAPPQYAPAQPSTQPNWPPPQQQQPAQAYAHHSPTPAPAPQLGYGHQQPVQHEAHYAPQPAPEPEVEIDVDEPPSKRRRWMIAAALVGSIVVGSGMAYAYKYFTSPKVTADNRGQVVRASREPTKVPPSNPGGKQFGNTDSRVLNNRLPSEGGAAPGSDTASSGFTNSSGVRVVQTVPVGPGGAAVAPSSGGGAVPGMMVVGPTAGVGLPPAMAVPPPLPPQQPAQSPAQQRVAAVPAPQPQAAPPAPRQPPAPRPQPAPAAEAEPPTRTAAAPAPKVPATERPKAVSGYVAVLGFQKSQLEAMKMMADLQQKYEPLRDKRLEIVQSDQSARGLGTIYRIVVGPRGGITPVRELCNQLQQAGMPKQGCYPLGE